MYDERFSEIAGLIEEIPDRELDTLSAGTSGVVGCPANIIPLFAGYSQTCADCLYFAHNGTGKQNYCALKED